MSDRRPKPKKADLVCQKLSEDSYIITACAPRDGAGRPMFDGDRDYAMNRKQLDTYIANLVMLRAGSPA